MSEELVPQGLPYGERQKIEEQMRAGSVPTEPPTGRGGLSLPANPAAARGGTAPRPSASLEAWDVLDGREPTMTEPPAPDTPSPMTIFEQRVAASPNTAMHFYFGRANEFLE